MPTYKTIALVLLIVLGIPNQIIDYRHRKRKAYEHGNAWAYYSRFSKEGDWEGRFMMWSGYIAIVFILASLGYLFYGLSR